MVLREEGVRMTSKITWRDEEKFKNERDIK
jgi:hypothetical protein